MALETLERQSTAMSAKEQTLVLVELLVNLREGWIESFSGMEKKLDGTALWVLTVKHKIICKIVETGGFLVKERRLWNTRQGAGDAQRSMNQRW